MLLNPRKELLELREEIMAALTTVNPTRNFRADMILAMVGLHQTEAQLRKSQDLQERRRLIHEFDTRKGTITQALQPLRKCAGESGSSEAAKRYALP